MVHNKRKPCRISFVIIGITQPGTYGDSIFLKLSDDSAFEFERNKWYEIEIAIRLNQVGSKNGRLYAKINQQSFSMPREFEVC